MTCACLHCVLQYDEDSYGKDSYDEESYDKDSYGKDDKPKKPTTPITPKKGPKK